MADRIFLARWKYSQPLVLFSSSYSFRLFRFSYSSNRYIIHSCTIYPIQSVRITINKRRLSPRTRTLMVTKKKNERHGTNGEGPISNSYPFMRIGYWNYRFVQFVKCFVLNCNPTLNEFATKENWHMLTIDRILIISTGARLYNYFLFSHAPKINTIWIFFSRNES